jgi:putative transposase
VGQGPLSVEEFDAAVRRFKKAIVEHALGGELTDQLAVLPNGTRDVLGRWIEQTVRRVIDTTNALESVNARVRKIIKTRGHFPTDEAATKLLWLALRNFTRGWTMPIRPWREAMSQFAVLYQDRFVVRSR